MDKYPLGWKLPYYWPESLAIKLANIQSSNGPQVRPSGSFNFYMWKNPPLLWLLTTPDLHPYIL